MFSYSTSNVHNNMLIATYQSIVADTKISAVSR